MKNLTAADFGADQNPADLTPKYEVGQHVTLHRAVHETMYKEVIITDVLYHPKTKHWPAHVGYLVNIFPARPKCKFMYDEEHLKPAN